MKHYKQNPLKFKIGQFIIAASAKPELIQGERVAILAARQDKFFNVYQVRGAAGVPVWVHEADLAEPILGAA
jgi:hypothetical protein